MGRDYIVASDSIKHDLAEAEIGIVAINGLLEDVIDPIFECFTCDGILTERSKHTGGDKNAAAREWMEENFDTLYAACYAARAISERAMDILQMLPVIRKA